MGDLIDELGQFTAVPERLVELIPDIGSDAAIIYLYLRYRTNRKRNAAWPSYDTMQRDLASRTTVKADPKAWGRNRISKALDILVAHNLLDKTKRFGQSTVYRLKRPPTKGEVPLVGDEEATSPSSADLELLSEVSSSSKSELKKFRNGTKEVSERDLNQIESNQSNSNQKKNSDGKPSRQPEAIKVFRENAHRFPAKAWWEKIATAIGEDPEDLERWGRVVFAWVGMGWNPVNVKGMLDCYQKREIPGAKETSRNDGYETVHA